MRAEAELRLAAEAEDQVVCQAHYAMATQYLEAAHGANMRLPPDPQRLAQSG
jgi:hypothetical protein